MSKLILHIGLAKTGTTTLQNYFYSNQKNLEGLDISYPTEFLHDGGAHHLLAMLAKEGSYNVIKQKLNNIKNKEITVMSSEELSTLSSHDILNLSNVLQEFFSEITVVITTRTAFSLLINNYKQQVREGYIHVSLIEFWNQAKRHARFLKLNELKEDWAKNTKSVKIISTETGLENYNGDIIHHFSELIDKDLNSFPKPKKNLNKSLSSSQIEMIRTIYYQIPRLWHPKITWDCRRFVYFSFQNISDNFKNFSDNNDFNFISYEKTIFKECCDVFDDKQYNITNILPSKKSHDEWKNKKIEEFHSNLKNLSEKKSYLLDKNDRDLIKNLLEFYHNNKQIHNLGPSVQLLNYKEKQSER